MFLVLAAKAPAPVWKVKRSAAGNITNLEKRIGCVSHYSFHIMDPDWGHVTIKMSGHPPKLLRQDWSRKILFDVWR